MSNATWDITASNVAAFGHLKSLATLDIFASDDGMKYTFYGEENGTQVSLEFSPEQNITAYEQLLLSNMIMGLIAGVHVNQTQLLKFVRKHRLERHFKFTAV